jgi:3-oxoacyl-[acyl-carrier protein] reductase
MPTTVIISGGSRGLGLAIVERLLERGDRVATFSRSGSAALGTLADRHPDRLHAEQVDAADSEAVRAFVGRAVARFGGVDHCIANAAVAHEGVVATMRDDEIDAMLGVNLRGSIVLVRECVRQMLVRPAADVPAQAGGPSVVPSVVMVSSVVASRGSPGLAVYAATKAGLEGFAKSLAREVGPRGIRVNVVAPGFLETDLSASLSEANRNRIARRTPRGRLGLPADIVGAIDFLTSPRAAFITGQILTIDGGSAG